MSAGVRIGQSATRVADPDAFRVVAILAIISLHALPFFGPAFQDSLARHRVLKRIVV